MREQFRQFSVCIPAGGSGVRMGTSTPKQYLPLAGIPVIARTVLLFSSMPECDQIVVAADDPDKLSAVLHDHAHGERVTIVRGGVVRQDSVAAAVSACSTQAEIILIHDAARPLVALRQVRAVVDAIYKFGAALLALPAHDTVKRVSTDARVLETLDRRSVWLAQTPQGARADLLRGAVNRGLDDRYVCTDDAE